jgi:cation diffusion facilitator CzcD-associated flavoprotein CzcO
MSPPRYPGVRCDVPSHSYQYTFESNTQWSEYYCEGAEIERYFQRVARKFGVYKYIKFKHMLKGATWNAEEGKWHVKLEDLTTGRVIIPREFDVFYANRPPDFCRHLRCIRHSGWNSQQIAMANHRRVQRM